MNGAVRFDEPGALMTFEENGDEMASDVASLCFKSPHGALERGPDVRADGSTLALTRHEQ